MCRVSNSRLWVGRGKESWSIEKGMIHEKEKSGTLKFEINPNDLRIATYVIDLFICMPIKPKKKLS